MPQHLRQMRASAAVHAVLFAAFAFLPTLPEGSYSDARVADLYAGGSDRALIVLSGVLLTLAALALLPFVAGLWQLLRDEDDQSVASVVPLAGVLHLGLLLVAATAFSGYATGLTVEELPQPVDTTLARVLSNQGFHGLLVPGLLAAGAMILATAVAGRRLLPRWLRRTSIALSLLTLLGAAWAPQFVPPLWALLISWSLPVHGRAGVEPTGGVSRR